jgi:WYL domain
MPRVTNQEHVSQTLRALSIMRSEPGWHQITRLAEVVGAKPARLGADLRRCCYAADDWHLPLMFGSDMEPVHPDRDAVVQLAPNIPLMLTLPTSRVELLRLALMAGAAARQEPNHPNAPILRTLDTRLTAILDSQSVETNEHEPENAEAIRSAIANKRQIIFMYRAMTDSEAARRSVIPLTVERRGKWWLFDAVTSSEGSPSTYRLDRIIGTIDEAANSDPLAIAPTSTISEPITSTKIRLEIHEDELWAVDDFAPTDLNHLGNEQVEVTIHLFEPVAERLSRLLFLTNPATTKIISGSDYLTKHLEKLNGR